MNDSLGAILAIVVLWGILRFAFGGSSSSSSSVGTNAPRLNNARARQVPQHMVDSVKALFPHIPEANIRYDLQRSGSAEATCERILNEGGLPAPPAGFFGTTDDSARTATSTNNDGLRNAPETPHRNIATSSSTSSPLFAGKGSSGSPNLISRYGLQSKISSEASSPSSATADSTLQNGETSPGNGWAQTPQERAKTLKDRKEKMILEARKKLLERQKADSSSSSHVA